MKNTAHLLASFYLLFNTDLTEEEFQNKFNHDTIINSKIALTTPDGITYDMNFANLVDLKIQEFENKEATKLSV